MLDLEFSYRQDDTDLKDLQKTLLWSQPSSFEGVNVIKTIKQSNS